MGKAKTKAKVKTPGRSTAAPSVRPPAGKSVRPPATMKSVPPAAHQSVRPPASKTMPVPAAPEDPNRKFKLRGAAPWAARHAERRAAEAQARLNDPPRPGSARATLRTPEQADRIKARIGELHNALQRVRALRKGLPGSYYDLGVVLKTIADERLFDAKGYATFEAFVDREVDLGKNVALRLARVPEVFIPTIARAYGLEATLAALEALENGAKPAPKKPNVPSRAGLPLKPPR
jgi:hypothetical protein